MKIALYDKSKGTEKNLEELYDAFGNMARHLSAKDATTIKKVVYSGETTSGSAKVPQDILKYTLFLAVVGDEPIVCAKYQKTICGKGIEEHVLCTLEQGNLSFEASNVFKTLIAIF